MTRAINATRLYSVVIDPNLQKSLDNVIVEGIDHVIVIRQ